MSKKLSPAEKAWETRKIRKKKGFYRHKRRKGEMTLPMEKPHGKGRPKKFSPFFTDEEKRVRGPMSRIPFTDEQARKEVATIPKAPEKFGDEAIATYVTKDGRIFDIYPAVRGSYWERQRDYKGKYISGSTSSLSDLGLRALQDAKERGIINIFHGKLPQPLKEEPTSKQTLKEVYRLYQQGMKEKKLMYIPYVAVAKSLEQDTILIERRNGKIVGFLRYGIGKREPVGRLQQIYVVPEYRGQGIASKLLKQFEETSQKQGMESIRLKTAQTNLEAIKFYEKHGFIQTAKGGKKVPEFVYEKPLRKKLRLPSDERIIAEVKKLQKERNFVFVPRSEILDKFKKYDGVALTNRIDVLVKGGKLDEMGEGKRLKSYLGLPSKPFPSKTRAELKEKVHRIVEKYKRRASVDKPIRLTFKKRGKKLATSKFHTDKKEAEVAINLKQLRELFEVDEKNALKFLEYAMAHEVAHIKQREEKGLGYFIGGFQHEIERDADERASKLSGITQEETDQIVHTLSEKVREKRGIPKPKPRAQPTIDAPRLIYEGKKTARIIAYESAISKSNDEPKVIPPRGNITEQNKQYRLPKKTGRIWIIEFAKDGTPIQKSAKWIPRNELNQYYLIA